MEAIPCSTVPGPADWVNHSCDPNAGRSGQISLVAMRDIAPAEEVCFDHAMSDGSGYRPIAAGVAQRQVRWHS